EAAEGVDELALRLRPRQRFVRMLTVQIDQVRSRLAELLERRGAAVDPCAAAALRVERSAQQKRPVVGEVLLAEPGAKSGRIGEIELGGNFRTFASGAQLARFEAADDDAIAFGQRKVRLTVAMQAGVLAAQQRDLDHD